MDLDESRRRFGLGDDPFHGLGVIGRHVDDAGRDPRDLLVDRPGERGRASAVLHQHEAIGGRIREHGAGRLEQEADVPLVGIGREADHHAAPGRRAGHRLAQAVGERIVGPGDDPPGSRRSAAGRGGRGRSASVGMNARNQRATPAIEAGSAPARAAAPARTSSSSASATSATVALAKDVGSTGMARAEPSGDLDHDLADRDRVQVQVAEQPAVVADR